MDETQHPAVPTPDPNSPKKGVQRLREKYELPDPPPDEDEAA